jgi:sugar (pentulose or hexulose) kinase
MSDGPLFLGIDLGTSGARAVLMDARGDVVAQAGRRLADLGDDPRDPGLWWQAVSDALDRTLAEVDRDRVRALAVDGTSGTLLAIDPQGRPLARPLMYSDKVDDAGVLEAIAARAPAESAAHGATSGLAKLIVLQRAATPWKVVHQADWVAGRLSGRFDVSDENNALKTGYDPVSRRWPEWIRETGADMALLPDVAVPGQATGTISAEAAARFGLGPQTIVAAGTTDGCASFLATGASAIGDGVSALGSTLTVKLMSPEPIFAPAYGIYSHRMGDLWLAGGASNTGGLVLAAHFASDRIARLSQEIDPETSTGLDYYPLNGPGERFPIADPALAPRMTPRPDDDATFLKAMLEGIAGIEELAYRRLAELGGPALGSLRSVGGGAANPAWTHIRQRLLGVPFLQPKSEEAAAGAARLAMQAGLAA